MTKEEKFKKVRNKVLDLYCSGSDTVSRISCGSGVSETTIRRIINYEYYDTPTDKTLNKLLEYFKTLDNKIKDRKKEKINYLVIDHQEEQVLKFSSKEELLNELEHWASKTDLEDQLYKNIVEVYKGNFSEENFSKVNFIFKKKILINE